MKYNANRQGKSKAAFLLCASGDELRVQIPYVFFVTAHKLPMSLFPAYTLNHFIISITFLTHAMS